MILRDEIIQILMQVMLLMQIIMLLVKKKWLLKIMLDLSNCISKINGLKIDNAEDLDVVMPMYNLPNSSTDNTDTTHLILNSESFDYKANFTENGVTQ